MGEDNGEKRANRAKERERERDKKEGTGWIRGKEVKGKVIGKVYI